MVTTTTSPGAAGPAGNDLLIPLEGSGVVVSASTVTLESAIVSSPLSFFKTPEKVCGPSATPEPTVTSYVNESTPTTVKVTVRPETTAPIAALGVSLAAEPST